MPTDPDQGSLNVELAIRVLIERVNRIEARQRAYGQHDPECPAAKLDIELSRQSVMPMIMFNRTCDCWLSVRVSADTSGATP